MLSAALGYLLFSVTLHVEREDTMSTATAVPNAAEQTVPAFRNPVVTWFEIPAIDFERAVHFYEAVFAIQMKRDPKFPGMAIFPYEHPAVTGCVVDKQDAELVSAGVCVFFNCDNKLDAVLERTIEAGQPIVEDKSYIPAVGWVARIQDTEGNNVGLHAII
jgi:uncharacterized protein